MPSTISRRASRRGRGSGPRVRAVMGHARQRRGRGSWCHTGLRSIWRGEPARLRPARAGPRLVRRARARPAVAAAGASAVVGDGLGVHAPADAGRRGCCRCTSSGWSGGRPRPPWPPSRRARRCGPGAGSATRAGRCGCTPRPWRSSSGTAARCRRRYDDLLALPGRRRLHRGRDRGVRLRPAARRARHQRAPGARAGAGRRRVPGRVGDPRRARPGRRRAARRRGDRRHLVGGGDGARGAGLHGGATRAAPRARSPTGAPGARPATRRTTGRRGKVQTWAGTDRQCRGRLLAVLRETRRAGAPAAGSTPPGPTTTQRERCLASLLDRRLLVRTSERTYALP